MSSAWRKRCGLAFVFRNGEAMTFRFRFIVVAVRPNGELLLKDHELLILLLGSWRLNSLLARR